MMPKYVLIDERSEFVLAREVEENGRVRYAPTLRTVSNSLITAEMALGQLNDGRKYRVLKEAVKAMLHNDPCANEKCAAEGVCSECLADLEDAYDALEGN